MEASTKSNVTRRGHEDEEDGSAAPPVKPDRSHWVGPSTKIRSSTTASPTTNSSSSSPTSPTPVPISSRRTKHTRKEDKDVVYQYWLSKVKSYGGCLEDAPIYLRSDKRIVMTAVKNDLYGCGCSLEHASPDLKNNKEVVIVAVRHNGEALQHASPNLRNDKFVVLIAVGKCCDAFQFASPELQKDKEVLHEYWLSKVQQFGGGRLEEAPESIRSDKTVVMTAVQLMEESLKYASNELRRDKEFMLQVAQLNPDLLRYTSPELRYDKDIRAIMNRYWLSRVTENGGNELRHAPEYIRDEKHIVIAAVQQNGWALQHASPGLQNDILVVVAAVQKEGRALEFASPELRSNKEVVLDAIENNTSARYFASPELLNDRQVTLVALQKDRECFMAAVQKDGLSLQSAPYTLQNEKQVVLAAVQQHGLALEFASPEVQNIKEVVMAAVNQHPDAIKYAHDDLKRDGDVLIAAGMYDEEHDDAVTRQKTKMGNTNKKKKKLGFLNRMIRKPNHNANDVDIQIKKKIALSTRFSLHQTSQSDATNFTKLLKSHEYIHSNFVVYAPNAFDKKTCDEDWTNFNHPCRGTKDTCQYDNVLTKDGYPTNDCCWRYSYRNQLEEAKSTGGFMLQLLESVSEMLLTEDASSPVKLSIGKGQEIELDMATQLKLKTFQVCRPSKGYGDNNFEQSDIERIVATIQSWYDNGCQDMSTCIVRPELL